MSKVWRPERRNRNIGKSWSGYSKTNDMRIPQSWQDKHGNYSMYYERLDTAKPSEVTIANFQVKFFYETPRDGFTYGCTPSDVIELLKCAVNLCPSLPDIIIFRQPTQKQQLLQPVWGRFIYCAEIEKHEGTAIILDAQELGSLIKWTKRMSIEDRNEFERLKADGHQFVENKRDFQAELSEDGIRNTKLYRTLLHELGHLADYHMNVLDRKTALAADQDEAEERYFSKPVSEREVFAHTFAEKLNHALREHGKIPFDTIIAI